MAFWKKYKTLESLYHIVYFYSERTFTLWIYGLDEPKRRLGHMEQGILYSHLYHEKINKDYSVVLSIRLYRTLYEILPEERNDIQRRTYTHHSAVSSVVRTDRRTQYTVEISGISDSIRRRTDMMGIEVKKGLELPLIPGQIGRCIQKNAWAVLKDHPDEMKRVYRLIKFILGIRQEEGLLALEDAIKKFNDFEALALYLYILTILIAQIESRREHILYREQAMIAWSRMRNECLSYLPEECRSVFQIYI